MSPRRMSIAALGALVPIWVYALGVNGGVPVAVASTACVFLIAGSLYAMLGPHDQPAESV